MSDLKDIKCVLLDIEGTVCPISFVKETLFPYAITSLPDVLATKWDDESFQPYRDAFPEEHRQDSDTLQAHVEDLTKRDVKIAYLKNLQGYLWEDGYKSGAYSTTLFPDVVSQLRRWKDAGKVLAIYSSGSVFAQKLLFGHVKVPAEAPVLGKRGRGEAEDEAEGVADDDDDDDDDDVEADKSPPSKKVQTTDGEAVDGAEANGDAEKKPAGDVAAAESGDSVSDKTEDLTDIFDGWFDTTNAGLKTESASYTKIAEALKWQPAEILFLSDNVKEVDAAIEAGMNSIVVDRPGNAPLSKEDKGRLEVVDSLAEMSEI